MLRSLERLLIVLQEQMEYLKNSDTDKDMDTQKLIKDEYDKEFYILKNSLLDLTVKAKKIIVAEEKGEKTSKYESLSFVKQDCEKCKKSILQILRFIYEINMKTEIDAKLNTILNWSEGIDQIDEENKSNFNNTVPKEIYGKKVKLCKIPIQTLNKVKELEERVHKLAKAAIIYKKK